MEKRSKKELWPNEIRSPVVAASQIRQLSGAGGRTLPIFFSNLNKI
jgi:hypothetical protein